MGCPEEKEKNPPMLAIWVIFRGALSAPFENSLSGRRAFRWEGCQECITAAVVIVVEWHLHHYEDLSTAVDERRAGWYLHPVPRTIDRSQPQFSSLFP